MGKNKIKLNSETNEKHLNTTSPIKVKKTPKPINAKLNAVIKSVGLPENAKDLTADQLTENQKHVLKKVCAKMYGHQHSEKRKLPANSLESATGQLEQILKDKLAQRKKEKKKLKQKQTH